MKFGGVYLFNIWGMFDENFFVRIVQNIVEELFFENFLEFYNVFFFYVDLFVVVRDFNVVGFESVLYEVICFLKEVMSWFEFVCGIVFGNLFGDEIWQCGIDFEFVVGKVVCVLRDFFGNELGLMLFKVNFFCVCVLGFQFF